MMRPVMAARARALGALATLVLCLGTLATPPAAAAPRQLKVVVIGDSYTAGNGAGWYYGPQGCYRSAAGWAEQYAAGLRSAGFGVSLVNRACSGAETADVVSERVMDSANHPIVLLGDRRADEPAARRLLTSSGLCVSRFPDEERYDITSTSTFNGVVTVFSFTCTRKLAPQIQAVGTDADLVLLTIGGNDVHFSSVVTNCFVIATPAGCRAAVTSANTLLGVVGARITDTLRALGARIKSKARIGLISYPYLEKNDNFTLTTLKPPDTYVAGADIRELGRRGDQTQTASVNAANLAAGRTFAFFQAGVKERFAGHEPDGRLLVTNPEGWLHELASAIPDEWYHPNPAGHFQYAGLLLESTRFGPTAFR
jgi:lysophospholipase L1-like esterase